MNVQEKSGKCLLLENSVKNSPATATLQSRTNSLRTLIAKVPNPDCRSAIISAIRSATETCAITVAGRQFALRFMVSNNKIVSFQILQHKSSTLWLHYFQPRHVFDVSKHGFVADIAQAEVNAAINTFSLFPGNCRIVSEPQNRTFTAEGLDPEFLGRSGSECNIQCVDLVPSGTRVTVDYSARLDAAKRTQPTARNVISMPDRKKTPAPENAENGKPEFDVVMAQIKTLLAEQGSTLSVRGCEPEFRPLQQMRSRLHLS